MFRFFSNLALVSHFIPQFNIYGMLRLLSIFVLLFSALTVSATSSFAQSCSLADVNTVNTNLTAPLAGGNDVIEIDLDNGGSITCRATSASANTAFNDRAEISHRLTAEPSDLHFVVDRDTAITAVNISGPGLAAGGVSPADDDPVDLSAGTYFVTMTVSGMSVSFNFTVVELAPGDQRLAAQPIAIIVGTPPTVSIANTTDAAEPGTDGLFTITQSATVVTDTIVSY